MPRISQIRGALLEEAVLFLLRKIGYKTIDQRAIVAHSAEGHGLRAGASGLEARGRGTWHQLDALAAWAHSPAFMYPLRLIVEAKCYSPGYPIGIDVPRNCVGVLKDVSENYFTIRGEEEILQLPRFNYAAAVFSASGFTRGAVEYAVAHQVFLIQYQHVPVMRPLIDAIRSFNGSCIDVSESRALLQARLYFRYSLSEEAAVGSNYDLLTEDGKQLLSQSATNACKNIEGSYFGMLQGRWPLHLLQREPLPEAAFRNDLVQCRVVGNQSGEWRFTPSNIETGDSRWFELEFSLPQAIAAVVDKVWDDARAVANFKQQHFSFIDLSGIIGGIRRNVRLQLDDQWIKQYLHRQESV